MVVHLLQKLSKKKNFFFEKIFFTKHTLFAKKMFLYGKKKVFKTFFTEENFFLQRKI